jgi:hypothetical protein
VAFVRVAARHPAHPVGGNAGQRLGRRLTRWLIHCDCSLRRR